MKPRIEHPHVFISYAWGSEEYQRKVIEFATSLMQCGIDVELDKWSLKEGNDTYAYMEQMVNNPDITNVLLLLDENYTKKANERKGGVGTETQIITPEIYEKVKQEKFIPIVFARGERNELFKPTFLRGLLHFDLTNDEKYPVEFQRLVKRLFGNDVYEKPEIGNVPDWVNNDSKSTKAFFAFPHVINAKNDKEKQLGIKLTFNSIGKEIQSFCEQLNINDENYIETYKSAQLYRDKVLSLVNTCVCFDGFMIEFCSFLEETKNIKFDKTISSDVRDTLLHEILIYVVAFLLKNADYKTLHYLASKTFFPPYSLQTPEPFTYFYKHNEWLDRIVCRRDNKAYYCGTAQLWIETINSEYITRNEFVFADTMLYNITVFGNNPLYNWFWFPVSYVYDERSSKLSDFSRRFASKEFLESVIAIFGFSSTGLFKDNFKIQTEAMVSNNRYRYPAAWHEAPLISDYIKDTDLGNYN